MQVNEIVYRFLGLLRAAWSELDWRDDDEKNDWLQANWEILVEGSLGSKLGRQAYLTVYGDGAEANGASSRILFPHAMPSYYIVGQPKRQGPLLERLTNCGIELAEGGVEIDKFVTICSGGWYDEQPPFDMVLTEDSGKEIVLAVEDLDFLAVELIVPRGLPPAA